MVPGEGGRATMCPATELESKVLDFLRRDELRADGESWHKHVSAERVLSGPGLVNLYKALSFFASCRPAPSLTPEQITQLALQGQEHICIQALNLFCAMLGTVAGNLALYLEAIISLTYGRQHRFTQANSLEIG